LAGEEAAEAVSEEEEEEAGAGLASSMDQSTTRPDSSPDSRKFLLACRFQMALPADTHNTETQSTELGHPDGKDWVHVGDAPSWKPRLCAS
jgi:hypothetical protein